MVFAEGLRQKFLYNRSLSEPLGSQLSTLPILDFDSMKPRNPRDVRMWKARAAVLTALPDVCTVPVRELFTSCTPGRQDTGERNRDGSVAIIQEQADYLTVVTQWAKAHRLDRDWLIAPLCSVVHFAVGPDQIDVLTRPWLWRQQLWDVSSFYDQALDKRAMFSQWEQTAGDPDPMAETLDACLKRTAEEYNRRVVDATAHGWDLGREIPELERHARWYLAYQVMDRETGSIAAGDRVSASAVDKAIRRFALLADLPRRPGKPGHRSSDI
jgi:hypothetical protein